VLRNPGLPLGALIRQFAVVRYQALIGRMRLA